MRGTHGPTRCHGCGVSFPVPALLAQVRGLPPVGSKKPRLYRWCIGCLAWKFRQYSERRRGAVLICVDIPGTLEECNRLARLIISKTQREWMDLYPGEIGNYLALMQARLVISGQLGGLL